MKFFLASLAVLTVVTAQGYNYPAPQKHVAPQQQYFAPPVPAPQPEYIPPPQQEYIPPAHVEQTYVPPPLPPAPIQQTYVPPPPAPVHQTYVPPPAPIQAPINEYIPPPQTAELHNDGYHYKTIRKFRLRRH